jgi:uncharacterized RDD family membrane protein YckC
VAVIETYDVRFDGVRRKRIAAFLVDFVLVTLISAALWVVVAVLGIFTFGLAWLLLGAIFPAVAILYAGGTIGGPFSATPGMRLAGLAFRLDDGGRPDFLYGAAHLVLFYLSVSFLTPFILLVSLFASRKRLLHDMVIGVVIENA